MDIWNIGNIKRNKVNKYYTKCFCLISVLCIASHKPLCCQIPDFSKVPSLHKGDSLNITNLINNGVKITNGKVIAWFPKDSLSLTQMNEITDFIYRGIAGAEKFIGAPLPWQIHKPNEPYTFYFRSDRFISHASQAGFVSIPFWRIKNGKSPWLHETLHEMLYTNTGSWFSTDLTDKEFNENMPLWLFEGLPDYISLHVSLKENLIFFDVFSDNFQTNIDSLFTSEIKAENGPYILSFIGSKGVIPELSSENRNHYAPAFYHGSCSFVKYLADNYGIKILLNSISEFRKEHETIEKLTGRSIAVLKKEWLVQLKIQE